MLKRLEPLEVLQVCRMAIKFTHNLLVPFSHLGTPRKETVYAKMVSLRRRTTSGDLKKIFGRPLGLSAKQAQQQSDQLRPRIQSESAASSEPLAAEGLPAEKVHEKVTATSSLKITDLKDFRKLSSSTGTGTSNKTSAGNVSVGSPSAELSPEDPFDHDNISYLNGSGNSSNGQSNNNTTSVICDRLPEPTCFGNGNPFLMFVCIACLLQHRNQIMNGRYDYQEIAMYFDKLVRKHDVYKTLNLARKLFAEYLNDDWSAGNPNADEEENNENDTKASC